MAKVTLSNVTNLQNESSAVATINTNSDRIEEAMEKTLSRDGTSPNAMEANLDLNGFRIINLPAASANTEPVRKLEFDVVTAQIQAIDNAVAAAEASATASAGSATESANSASDAFDSAVDSAQSAENALNSETDAEAAAVTAANILAKSVRVDVVQSFTAGETLQGRQNLSISAANTPLTPVGGVAATDVQAAIQELDTEKANLASPALTGVPTAPTASQANNSTQIATTAYVDTLGSTKVTGPGSASNNAAVKFDGATGKLVKNSVLIVADTTGALSRSGGGGIQQQGTNTNDNAAAGEVGEYVSSTVLVGSAVALTTATTANITSISLTAGDWDVWVNARFTGGATTTVQFLQAGISTTSATLSTAPGQVSNSFHNGQTPFASITLDRSVGPIRFSLAGTTTVFFVVSATFATSTCSGFGIIQARRVR